MRRFYPFLSLIAFYSLSAFAQSNFEKCVDFHKKGRAGSDKKVVNGMGETAAKMTCETLEMALKKPVVVPANPISDPDFATCYNAALARGDRDVTSITNDCAEKIRNKKEREAVRPVNSINDPEYEKCYDFLRSIDRVQLMDIAYSCPRDTVRKAVKDPQFPKCVAILDASGFSELESNTSCDTSQDLEASKHPQYMDCIINMQTAKATNYVAASLCSQKPLLDTLAADSENFINCIYFLESLAEFKPLESRAQVCLNKDVRKTATQRGGDLLTCYKLSISLPEKPKVRKKPDPFKLLTECTQTKTLDAYKAGFATPPAKPVTGGAIH